MEHPETSANAMAEAMVDDAIACCETELILTGARFAGMTRLPAAIASFDALDNLEIQGAAIDDISALAELPWIRFLYLEDLPLKDIAPLAGLTSLRGLSLIGSQVEDLSPLAGLTGLEWLTLDGCPVWDLEPLAGLRRLWHLSISGTKVADLRPLQALQELASASPHAGLSFRDIPALDAAPDLAAMSQDPDPHVRARAVLNWLAERADNA